MWQAGCQTGGMDLKSFVQRASGSKAIPAHPVLLQGEPPITVRGFNQPERRVAFGQREAGRHLAAYGGSVDAIDWVMNCVKLIAETASEADWHFERDGEKLVNHKGPLDRSVSEAPTMAVKLFEEPNPYMGWHEHFELTIIDYILAGNAYWLHWRQNDAGQPLALYRLSPRHVKVVPGPFGVEQYEYQLPEMSEPMRISPEEITHFRQANPHNPHFGLGHVQGASRMLDAEIALTDTVASYFEKRAQPSMVVQSERRVPDAVFKKLKGQLRAMYSGPRNAGQLMVLEAGLKYQSISPSAVEAGFENLSKLSRDRILALFRVPAVLLGIQETGDTKFNEAQRVFDTKTMRPLLDKLQTEITRSIAKAWELDFVIEYDYIMPIEDRLKLASTFAAIPGVKLGEVRDYVGLPLLGDERDDMVLNLPGEEVDAGGHPEIADRNLAGEPGRPPKGSNTAAFPEPGGALPAAAKVSRKGWVRNQPALIPPPDKGGPQTLEELSERLNALVEQKAAVVLEQPERTDLERRITPPNDVLKGDREAQIDAIQADLEADLINASHTLERALLDHVEGKASGTIYQRIKNSEAWKTFQAQITDALERASRRAITAAAVQQARVGIRPEEELDADDLAKLLVHDRKIGGKSIMQTLRDRISQKVLKIQQAAGGRDDLEAAVREGIASWQGSGASSVALTSLTHAYNEGVLSIAELAGFFEVFVHDGDDHDQPCVDANGQVWSIEKARENRLEHPNCRRGFTILTDPAVT